MALLEAPIKGYNPPRQQRGKIVEKKLTDALLRLLAKGLNYTEITNQDILDEANKQSRGKSKLYMQSLYQWFEHGKDTIVSVLAANYDAHWAKELEAFFLEPSSLGKDTLAFVKALINLTLTFYQNHKEYLLIWHNQSIPATLRNPSEASRQFIMKLVVDFLQKCGIGQRRYLIAPVVYTVVFMMQELSIKPVFDTRKGFDLFVDKDIQEELECLLVRYLEPYFDGSEK